MAIQDKNTIRNWFLRGLKPTQAQFWDTWDSFWHKLDKISIDAIEGLGKILNNKAEVSQLEAHVNNTNNPHKITIEQVGGAQEALELKANKGHRHPIEEVSSLREELDDLMQIAAIRGFVETYAKLKELDIDNLVEGDSYIVEQDESRENVTTIYVLSNLEESLTWIFAGQWSAGAIYLPDLEDTSIMNLKTGQILKYNGVKWVNTDMVFSVIPDTSKIIVKSTIGEGFTLPSATTTTAGLMTATDKAKIDSLSIMPIVQIAVANYSEFKDAVAKLNIIVDKGGFGEIIQTGEWVINDDSVHDLTNIKISNNALKRIIVTSKPFKIKGRVHINSLYLFNDNVPGAENKTMLEIAEGATNDFLFVDVLYITNATGTNPSSVIPVIEVKQTTYFALRIMMIRAVTLRQGSIMIRPANLLIKIPRPQTIIFARNLIKDVTYTLDHSYDDVNTSIHFDESVIFKSLKNISSRIMQLNRTFVTTMCNGSVPAPLDSEKTKYHMLNANGEWIDIRTLI